MAVKPKTVTFSEEITTLDFEVSQEEKDHLLTLEKTHLFSKGSFFVKEVRLQKDSLDAAALLEKTVDQIKGMILICNELLSEGSSIKKGLLHLCKKTNEESKAILNWEITKVSVGYETLERIKEDLRYYLDAREVAKREGNFFIGPIGRLKEVSSDNSKVKRFRIF